MGLGNQLIKIQPSGLIFSKYYDVVVGQFFYDGCLCSIIIFKIADMLYIITVSFHQHL